MHNVILGIIIMPQNVINTLRIFQKMTTRSVVMMALRMLNGSKNAPKIPGMLSPMQIALRGDSDK